LITSREDSAAKLFTKLDLNNEDKDKVMTLLENEIFDFIEKTHAELERSLTTNNSNLDALVKTGTAILKIKPSQVVEIVAEPTIPNEMSEQLHRFLKTLKKFSLFNYENKLAWQCIHICKTLFTNFLHPVWRQTCNLV